MEDGDIQIINKFVTKCTEQQEEIERLKKKISELENASPDRYLEDDRDIWCWIAHHQLAFIKEKDLNMDFAKWDYEQREKAKATNNTKFLNMCKKAEQQSFCYKYLY